MAKYLQAQDRSGRGANQNISGECTRTARNYQDAILCARYTGWSHAKCLQLSKSTFKYYLQHQEIEWTCSFFSLPNFSDSSLMTTTQMSALEKTTTWIQRMISFPEDDAQMDVRQFQQRKTMYQCKLKHQQSTKQICRDKRKARFQRFCHSFGARNQDRSLVPKHPIPRGRL